MSRLAAGVTLAWATALAQSPVEIAVGRPETSRPIPADFVGLSFEISNVLPDQAGEHMFSADNRALIDLFRVVGIKNLRVGGGTTEPKTRNETGNARFAEPGPKDIDALFAFAEAADVRVIYSLRLLNGDKQRAAATASYIMSRYRSRLDSFSIGNEPDWHAYHTYAGRLLDPTIFETEPGRPGSAYPSYLVRWREFAAAIAAAVPDAKFSGPDTGSNYPVPGALDTRYEEKSWTENFAHDEKGSANLIAVLPHDYVGQSAEGVSVAAAVEAMLSREWPRLHYSVLFDRVLARVERAGFGYRMTECNDYTGGVDGASNAFVSALWALDYLHWHAAHGALGLNFHNKRWIHTCTITRTPAGEFRLNPKAYGLKAFALGSRGRVAPVKISNADAINLTAYAVIDDGVCHVTIVNKEHGAGARSALVTISAPGVGSNGSLLVLTSPNNDPAAREGITLGAAPITNDGTWSGHWAPLAIEAAGRCSIAVAPTSAVIVRWSAR